MAHPSPTMPALAFIAAGLVLLPFAVQRTLMRRQYLPALCLALWLCLANIVCGVNSIVWADTSAVHIPVWCDISTKFMIGVSYAVPASLFSIAQRLRLASSRHVIPVQRTDRELRDSLLIDAILGVGMPLTAMVLHTVVQTHRFDIVEGLGCQPEIPAVSAGTVFFWLPALVFSVLSLYFCCSSWRNVLGPERGWLQVYLENFDPALTVHLFASHAMLVLCVASLWVAFLVVTIVESLNLGSAKSVDWARIDTYELDQFDGAARRDRMFCWWTVPAAALAFAFWFLVFPAADKADRAYAFVCGVLSRRTISNDSIITLRDLKTGESTPGRVVVRKCSTVEIRIEEYAMPLQTYSPTSRHAHSASTSPVVDKFEPRWSIPWETARPDEVNARSSHDLHLGGVVVQELPTFAKHREESKDVVA